MVGKGKKTNSNPTWFGFNIEQSQSAPKSYCPVRNPGKTFLMPVITAILFAGVTALGAKLRPLWA